MPGRIYRPNPVVHSEILSQPVVPFSGWSGHTYFGERVLHPLAAFEASRIVLGHTAVIGPVRATELVDATQHASPVAKHRREDSPFLSENAEVDYLVWSNLLVGYAEELHTVWRGQVDPQFSDPVLPWVDVANGQVGHTTCTGGTQLMVWLRSYHGTPMEIRWNVYRFQPWDMRQGRDLALAALVAASRGVVYRTMSPLNDGRLRTVSDSALVGEPDLEARVDACQRLQAALLTADQVAESFRLLGLRVP